MTAMPTPTLHHTAQADALALSPAPRTGSQLFGTLLAEVVAPQPGADLTPPSLPGWELRLWPVARLGDATLEARPLFAHLQATDLQAALAHAGWQVLGPLRARFSP